MNLEEIVFACYEKHKSETKDWTYGKPHQAYFDLEGLLIKYNNGQFHYKPINENTISWW